MARTLHTDTADLTLLCPHCGLEQLISDGRRPDEPEVEEEACEDCGGDGAG